jgi:GNAT superfamily N-acetyltransferase
MTTTPDGVGAGPSITRPDRAHDLTDAAGTILGWTVIDGDNDSVRAEPLVRLPRVDARHLAAVAAVELAGMRIATDDEDLAHALLAAGGRLARRASVMVAPPRPHPASVTTRSGYQLIAMDRLATRPEDLADALTGPHRGAYPATHPDHDPDTDATAVATASHLRALLGGGVTGPLEPALSAIVRTATDPVGAIIVTRRSADTIWAGGPWIVELFVDPRHAGHGLGRSLLEHTLSAGARLAEPHVGLAVTHGNPAAELYRSAGFRDVFRSWAIELPREPTGDLQKG